MNESNPMTEDIWLSEPELRERLAYSRSTIARLRKRGLPCIGHDRLRRYHLPSVLQWLSGPAQDSQTAAECASGDHDPARPGTRLAHVLPANKRGD